MSGIVVGLVVAVLITLTAGVAFTRVQLRRQFGREEGSVRFAVYARRWLPLVVVLTALPLVPLAFVHGADIERLKHITWTLWVLMGTATLWVAGRVLTRDRRLGPALVTVPAPRWLRVLSVGLGLMGLVSMLLWAATFEIRGALPSNPPSGPVFLMWAWLQSRCSYEIRPVGVCNAFREWPWARVRAWAWEPSPLRPMLRLNIGRWPGGHWEIPEHQRAAVDMAFAQFAGAKS
jgi:hypothetical protein